MDKFLRIITGCLAALLLAALALLSIRGMLDPQAAARAFGVLADHPSASFYHAIYRDRNLVLSIVGIVFLLTSMWRALAILTTAAITLPAYDIAVLRAADVPVAAVHTITLAALLVLASLLWWRVRQGGAEGH